MHISDQQDTINLHKNRLICLPSLHIHFPARWLCSEQTTATKYETKFTSFIMGNKI